MANATDTFGIALKNDMRECARLRAAVDEFTAKNKFPKAERFELQACLQDAVMDIVKGGFENGDDHEIDIQMLFQRKRRILTIRIANDGKTLNAFGGIDLPDRASQGHGHSAGATGLCSMHRYADQMSYFRQGRYNHLILSRIIPERSNSPAATPSA